MGQLRSKWPGKCKVCGGAHAAGDIVWWDKNQKGVKCMGCATGIDDAPIDIPPKPISIDGFMEDDLKKAQPTTLKHGHLLTASSQAIIDMFGCGLHDFDACLCPGCIIRRSTMLGPDGEGGSVCFKITVDEPLRTGGVVLYPGMSGEHRSAHLSANSPYYRIRFDFTRNYKPFVSVRVPVPLHYIVTKKLSIVGGSWEANGIADDIGVLYANGMRHIELHDKTPEVLVQAPPGKIMLQAKPITYDNYELFAGSKVMAVGFDENTPCFGYNKYHEDVKCSCVTCRLCRRLTKPEYGDVFNVLRAVPGGYKPSIYLTHPDFPGATVSVSSSGTDLQMRSIIASHGLAFVELPEQLIAEGQPVPDPAGIVVTKDIPLDKEAPVVTPNLNEAATTLLAVLQSSAVNEAKVREIALDTITTELKKLPVKNHKIKFNDGAPLEFDGILHGMATEIAEAIVSGFHNIMVVGPAGSGKTYLFSQVSDILKTQMKWDESDYKASMSCAPGQTESMFIGRMIPSLTTGTESYHGTNLTRLYAKECGGAFLFDEISNSEPTVMNLVNSMIALDGHVTLPDGRVLERPKNMVIFAADNTWGQGGDRMYIRNQLDAATLDRFTGAKFFMDYDEKLELALCPIKEVYDAVIALRKKVADLKLRRIVSTRAFAAAHRMGSNGLKNKEIIKRLTIDWSENDRKSVGA